MPERIELHLRIPLHPRLFSLLVKTGFVAMVTTECAILGMAAEKRHKLLSFLGMVGEERHKALLVLLFNVYFTGSELTALPVTPSEGPSQGVWMLAEAYRAAARSLRRYSWSLNAIGVFWQCTPQTMTQPIMHEWITPPLFPAAPLSGWSRQCPGWCLY